MNVIDAHQHFWQYNAQRHEWISEEMKDLRKDFLPADLLPITKENNVEGCVAIQVDQTEEETMWLLSLAEKHSFVKGVVGWVDLTAINLMERLKYFSSFPLLKGFRHILQTESPSFIKQASFVTGIGSLKNFHFTYDILIYPKHLHEVFDLCEKNPEQRFVIDHLAKPLIKVALIADWKKQLQPFGALQNVYCKISGLTTEANWNDWTLHDVKPYLEVAVEVFGSKRIMFGSDWPVCLVASSYQQWLHAMKDYFSGFSTNEQEQFFSLNARHFYNL